MKFEVDRQLFLEALKKVAGGVSKRYTLPVLSHVNITATGGEGVKLATTNLALFLQTAVTAAVTKAGAINLPHKLLTDVLTKMDGEQASFVLNPKKEEVTITSGEAIVILRGIDAGEFTSSQFQIAEPTEVFTVSSEWLKQRLNAVVFSVADDDTRPSLRCVRWMLDGCVQTMVAVDGFRLTRLVETLNEPLTKEPRALNLLADSLQPILAVLDDSDVTITLNCQKIAFESANIRAVMELADVNFPQYEEVIPQAYEHTLLPSPNRLSQACELVLLLTEDKVGLKISYQPGPESGSLEISAISSAGNGAAICPDVALTSQVEATPGTFGVNGRYLIAALAHAPQTNLEMKMNQPTEPMALMANGDNQSWLHLIMPMHFGR